MFWSHAGPLLQVMMVKYDSRAQGLRTLSSISAVTTVKVLTSDGARSGHLGLHVYHHHSRPSIAVINVSIMPIWCTAVRCTKSGLPYISVGSTQVCAASGLQSAWPLAQARNSSLHNSTAAEQVTCRYILSYEATPKHTSSTRGYQGVL